MSKVAKYIMIFFAGLFLLLTALLLYTQSASFKEKLKVELIKLVEGQLELKLEIEKLDGNLFHYVTLENIRLSKSDSTVAEFTSLKINYRLIPLTSKTINVDSLIIENPIINVWQNKDSTWSLSQFVKASDRVEVQQSAPFSYSINLGYLGIKNGNISTQTFSTFIPEKTQHFNLIANGFYNTDNLRIQLKKLDFTSEDPSIVLNQFSGIFKRSSAGIQLDSLILKTAGSAANMSGEYVSTQTMSTNVEANTIDKNEISIFIPSIKLNCSPALKASFKTVNDSLTARVELKYKNESMLVELALNPFSNLLNKTEPLPYFATLSFINFNIENWTDFNNEHILLDGQIKINGSNLFNYESRAKIAANLNGSVYNQITFHTLRLNGTYLNNSLDASVKVGSYFANALVSGKLRNISKIPEYDVNIKTEDFDVTAFIPELEGTKINGTIQAKGRGFSVDQLATNASLNLNKSIIYNYPVDSLTAQLNLQKLQLKIDTFLLYVPGAFAHGSGDFNIDSLILESVVYADIDSLTVIDSIVELPVKFESAKARTILSGPVDKLKISGEVEIKNAEGYSVKFDRANSNYLVTVDNDSINIWVNSTATKVESGPAILDTVRVEMNYLDPEVDLIVNAIWKDTVDAKFSSKIRIGDTLSFVVPYFEAKTFLSNYYLDDTLKVTLAEKDKFEIQNLKLKDHERSAFILSLDGVISTTDTNYFELVVQQADLAQINQFLGEQDSLRGLLNTNFTLRGNSINPSIEGGLEISDLMFGGYELSKLYADFNYADQKGMAELRTPDLKELYASFSAPFRAYFDSLEFIFTPPDTFDAHVILDSLSVSNALKDFIPNDSINGILNVNLKAHGDYENPLFYGKLEIIDGHYTNKEIGVKYDHIQAAANFDGKKVTLDTLLVKQKSGLFSITGEVEFDSTIVKGNIVSSSLTADANNFFLAQHRNYDILIDAKTFVKTGNTNPEFGGNIKVIRSDIFLPAFMSSNKGIDENNIPMLVEALNPKPDSVQLKIKTQKQISKSEKIQEALLDKLTGKLNVEIPRNTWIKSDDMRIELRGDVDIVKTGPYFELFGNIDIVRGQYILYGKKLKIQESQIIFQGGEKLDPNLNFIAEYVYRGSDKQKRYLELLITGKSSEPEIRFTLDGNEITETDGISILVFGAASDEIGYSGQNGLVGSIGTSAVASVITSQLSKTIGTQLNLDMIEVTATENWQSAAFMVGKYITNDIFVMYQRGFGEVEGDEITPETVTVEYELNNIVFLRLQSGSSKTSGLDMILKFEQKKK